MQLEMGGGKPLVWCEEVQCMLSEIPKNCEISSAIPMQSFTHGLGSSATLVPVDTSM